MLKAFKYAIIPTAVQQQQLAGIFGSVRFVWNLGLETRIIAYKSYGKSLNCFDLSKQTTDLKQTDAPWLGDCPSQALQMTLRNQDNAYRAFFKGGGFPKFKSKQSKSWSWPNSTKRLTISERIFCTRFRLR